VDSLAELPEDVFADQNLSRLRHALHTRRSVHPVPVEIPVGRNGDVTEVDAYAQSMGPPGPALGYLCKVALKLDGCGRGPTHAGELGQHRISHEFDHRAAVYCRRPLCDGSKDVHQA